MSMLLVQRSQIWIVKNAIDGDSCNEPNMYVVVRQFSPWPMQCRITGKYCCYKYVQNTLFVYLEYQRCLYNLHIILICSFIASVYACLFVVSKYKKKLRLIIHQRKQFFKQNGQTACFISMTKRYNELAV